MAKIQKPDKSQILREIREIEKINRSMDKALSLEESQKQKVLKAYEAMKKSQLKAVYQTMPISDINKFKSGIRVNLLEEAGIKTIGDLEAVSKINLLTGINGIGEAQGKAILENYETIKAQMEEGFTPKINPDHNDVYQDQLLGALYPLSHCKQAYAQVHSFKNRHQGILQDDLKKLKESKSGLKWLFSSNAKKEERAEACKRVEDFLSSNEAQKLEPAMAQIQEAKMITLSTIKEDFSLNNASYYAILEQVLGYEQREDTKRDLTKPGYLSNLNTADYLPEELVKQINAIVLDESLMKATLRKYQGFGTKYIISQKRVLLGDEMGLGKTMQAIASMAHLKASGRSHFLVICPVSVLVNWEREIKQHSDLSTIVIYSDNREEEWEQWVREGGVGITNFDTIKRFAPDFQGQVDMLTVDEAHYIKNQAAQRTQAVGLIREKSDYVLYMSGTPLENKLEEMIYLISCLQPELANKVGMSLSSTGTQEFKRAIAPVYLRRVREDVLTEIPEKIEMEDWCKLSPQEEEHYIQALSGSFMEARQVSWNMEDPAQSSKASLLREICLEAKEEGRKTLVFSFFKHTLDMVMQLFPGEVYGPISGSISPSERQKIVDEFTAGPDGSVLVSQIEAGGVGLNIQAASVVVICEPQYKPSTEVQAIARAYRMGQSKTVLVHRLLAEDTIDERLMEVLKKKSAIFDQYADDSEISNIQLEEEAKEVDAKTLESMYQEEKEKYGLNKKDET